MVFSCSFIDNRPGTGHLNDKPKILAPLLAFSPNIFSLDLLSPELTFLERATTIIEVVVRCQLTLPYILHAECDGVWIVGTKSQQESGENANDGRQHWLQEIRAAQGKLFYYLIFNLTARESSKLANTHFPAPRKLR